MIVSRKFRFRVLKLRRIYITKVKLDVITVNVIVIAHRIDIIVREIIIYQRTTTVSIRIIECIAI